MTAIEWFATQLGITTGSMIEKAMEMEKQQIIDAWNNGEESEYQYHINAIYRDNAEQYYNQTYGK